MNKKAVIYGLALPLLLSIISSCVRLASYSQDEVPTPVVYIDPSRITTLYDTNLTVNVNIKDVTDIDVWQAQLKWDPNVLSLTGEWPITNQSEGWVFLHWFDFGNPISGSRTMENLTFQAVGLGQCALGLHQTKLFNSESRSAVPAPPNLGDVNGDNKVNQIDNGYVAHAFASSEGQPRYNPNADFNKDGLVDFFDLLCVPANWQRTYPSETANKPSETIPLVRDGSVAVYSSVVDFPVTWKWIDYYENPVWMTSAVSFVSSSQIQNFNFDRPLGQISFDLSSTTAGFCNVTVPKLVMDSAFKILINDVETPLILTWNKTHTFIYFTHSQGLQNAAIVGEIVTRIRSKDLITMADVNGDGLVNILDFAALAVCNQWKEDR